MEVLVFGSLNVDLICYVDRLPKSGETIHGSKFNSGFGGKGANQCVAAAKLGARSAIIGKVGDDTWGKEYLAELVKLGVNVDFVESIPNEATGMAQITVAGSGENTIVIVVGANGKLNGTDVEKAKVLFDSSKILICQLESSMSATIEALKSFKGISIFNAAPALANTPSELLTLPTIFCVNETEAELTAGLPRVQTIEEAKEALKCLMDKGANTVILTMGALGAVYVQKSEPEVFIHVPAPDTKNVVDTTGAGDAFIGALAYGLARHPQTGLHQCIGAACMIAADTVTRCGTQTSFPTSVGSHFQFDKVSYVWKEI